MDNKDLITRFAEDCFRFEALHQEIDSLIADADSEVLAYEYEDLANQAAEIVLKLSANGNNVGEKFYRYYVERLEYIIDYFRALLDYEETPLAEDEPNELDDATPAEFHFEGFPAGCAFPKKPDFVIKKWAFKFTPTAKNEANAATDEVGAVEEDDSEDEPSDEVDNENDAQAPESDEAGAVEEDDSEDEPSAEVDNENDAPLDRKTKQDLEEYKGWVELSKNERQRVLDTLAVYVGLPSAIHEFVCAPRRLQVNNFLHGVKRHFNLLSGYKNFAEPVSIRYHEGVLRGRIWKVINGVENFRDSQMYNALVKLYPTYKEEEDGEDEQSDEVDNEDEANAAESDEAADGIDWDSLFSPDGEPDSSLGYHGFKELSSADKARVRDTFEMWGEMNEVTGRNREDGKALPAAGILEYEDLYFVDLKYDLEFGDGHSILIDEQRIRGVIEEAIDAIPGFRDSEKFKELIERYPTYKEI